VDPKVIETPLEHPHASLLREKGLEEGGQDKSAAHEVSEEPAKEDECPYDSLGGEAEGRPQQQHRRETTAGPPNENPIAVLGGQLFGRAEACDDSGNGGTGFFRAIADVSGDLAENLLAVIEGHRGKIGAK
jgi:hypothetical protein